MLDYTVKRELPKVLFPSIRNLQVLPPVINLINCLGYGLAKVTVISYDLNKDSFQNGIEVIPIFETKYPKPLFSRIKAKVRAYFFMYNYLNKNAKKFDYIWIGSWDFKLLDIVARLFGFKGKIIFQFHELEFEKLKYCRKADYCVVPEENRLWITYFLGKLARKPFLLPNIPFLPFDNFNQIPDELLNLKNSGRKIILYQGLINFEKRCLNELLEAVSFLPNSFALIIMPMPSTENNVLEQLKKKIVEINISENVFILKPVLPPYHLNYIKYADVGIGLYRPTTLNQIYAAPNRLFEFTKFSVPIILPNFPVFKALSALYRNGIITVNPESSKDIADSILKIFDNVNLKCGKEQSRLFFEENGNYEDHVKSLWKEIVSL